MKHVRLPLFALLLFQVALSPSFAQTDAFSDDDVKRTHPRLLASAADFERMGSGDWDALGEEYLSFLRQTGESMLPLPPLKREMQGRRLLHTSRKALKRISTWALLYRIHGDLKFRDRSLLEMKNIAAFSDWNPSHYLDVGEMALALSIGLDWLWDDLTPEQRNHFLDTLVEKGIKPSLDEQHEDNWWLYYPNNWNPVCHSGIVAGALLLVDRNPDLANQVINRALKAVPHAMNETDPDGVYPEGPTYWTYGTHFTAVLIELLENACGTSYGLAEHRSFRKSIEFRSHAVTPTGNFYNFYDNGETVRFEPVIAWFGKRFASGVARYELQRGLKSYLRENNWDPEDSNHRNLAMLALWYPQADDKQSEQAPKLPNNWQGAGSTPVAFIREAWGDPDAFFLGFKGGDGTVSHAHMDAGSFIYEDEGVRWALDLGAQNYLSLESEGLRMWDRRQHSDRWRIFRIGPHAHNLLLIDQREQDVTARATISPLVTSGRQISATVDLSPVYTGQAATYERDFTVHDYKVLQITDRIRGARKPTGKQSQASSATLRWRMLTKAKVTIEGSSAVLHQDGKTLWFHVASPEPFRLRAAPIDPPPNYYDDANPGVTAIDIWSHADTSGNKDITLLMSTGKAALQEIIKKQ